MKVIVNSRAMPFFFNDNSGVNEVRIFEKDCLEFDALWPFKIHLRSARRILRLCDDNKGFYVKAGQFVAAMRQVPREYSSTLSSLQDQVLFVSFD